MNQDVLVPSGGAEQCLSGGSGNPYAVTLMPTPHDHFHVCGGTSACRLRCGVELAALQAEMDYASGAGLQLHMVPTLFNTFVESPLFSSFNGPGSVSMTHGFVAAILNSRPALLCSSCGANDDCVVVALTPWDFHPSTRWEGVSIAAYCVPPAQQLTAYVRISGNPSVDVPCPAYVCGGVGGEATLTFVDFARQPPTASGAYLLLGFSSTGTGVYGSGAVALQTTSHMVYVVSAHSTEAPPPFLHSLTLQSQVLTPSIIRYIFGSPSAPAGTTVTGCAITTLVEVLPLPSPPLASPLWLTLWMDVGVDGSRFGPSFY